MEENELIAFQMIAAAGTAKGCYLEALSLAKEGRFQEAEEKLKEGEDCFVEGHNAHAGILQRMAGGEQIVMDVLMVHAEDQMMSTETIRIMVDEMIALYRNNSQK